MKNAITVLVFFLFCSAACKSQTIYKQQVNALSFEIGKTGLLYNLTFDHRFENQNFGIRFAAGSNFAKYLKATMVGGGGYYLAGKERSFLELGADLSYLQAEEYSDDQKGFTLFYPDHAIKTYYVSLNIGYRKYGKRSLFRIGLSPGFINEGFVPGGYISYGITF